MDRITSETMLAATPPFVPGDRVVVVETPVMAHRGVTGTVERCTRPAGENDWLCYLRLDVGTRSQYRPAALALAEKDERR